MSSAAVGRCTLTTTRSPLSSTARCTWPIVPAASGSGSIVAKTSSQGTPSSSSITITTAFSSSGVTRSCSAASSATASGGIRSGRVERIWPSLAKVGPSSSSASRRRRARSSGGSSSRRDSLKPYLPSTVAIRAARPSSRWSAAALTRRPVRLDDHDRAGRVVRDAVRDVAQQELAATAHADAADHEHVGLLPPRRLDDRLGRIVAGDDRRPLAFAGQRLDVLGQLVAPPPPGRLQSRPARARRAARPRSGAAISAAKRTARSAVSERSVATSTSRTASSSALRRSRIRPRRPAPAAARRASRSRACGRRC